MASGDMAKTILSYTVGMPQIIFHIFNLWSISFL